jgi:hypothetical protein
MTNQRKEQVRLLFRPSVLSSASAKATELNIPLSVYVEAAVDAYNHTAKQSGKTDDTQL